MESYNSLSTQLNQLYTLWFNLIGALDKINLATTTNENFIQVELKDLDGNSELVNIPSFKYLLSEIKRLDNNINSLSGLNSNSQLLLDNGETRKVISSKIPKSPNSVKEILFNNRFEIENNWYFENFLNPSSYIELEIPSGLDFNIKNVKVQRFILDIQNSEQANYFKENINGKNNINRNALISDLANQGINYFIDDNVISLPIIENPFYGKFSVIRIEADLGNNTKRYKLDKLTYSDKNSVVLNSIGLKIGDELTVNEYTRYRVENIDSSLNLVDLRLIEGLSPVVIGVDVLEIYKVNIARNKINVKFGFNERQVVFIKPIDDLTNLESDDWSLGVAFYSNDLQINRGGDIVNYENFYKSNVSDFGALLLGMAKDKTIPAALAEKPNPPVITTDLFKVVVSNAHLRNELVQQIEKLNKEKENLSSVIKNLDNSINDLKITINNKNYSNESERLSDSAKLDSLQRERDIRNSEFSSIVDSILKNNTLLTDESYSPRYRIRGFFPIPEPKISKLTKSQEIIGFEYEYRYLNLDGTAKSNEEFEVNGNKGVFSNWNRVRGKIRERVFNTTTNEFEFVQENIDSSEEINSNQIDVPISPNEIVQIRIRSISEAGFPQNPIYSDYSDIITVNFPSELTVQTLSEEILRSSEQEAARLRLEGTLANLGVTKHISDAVETNNVYYAHSARQISSGFLSPEQTPISLFDKITSLQNELNLLSEKVNRVKGTLRISLVDENNSEIVINNNSSEKIFAGYYENLVKDLTIKKGAIITKTYFLVIENVGSNDLELLTFYPSVTALDSNTDELEAGSNPLSPVSPNYNQNYAFVQYAGAPLLDIANNPLNDQYSYQKKQEYGQYLYNRKISIDGRTPLYDQVDIINDSSSSALSPIIPIGNTWVYDINGNQKTPGVDRYADLGIDVHEEYFNSNNIPFGTNVGFKISGNLKSTNKQTEYDPSTEYPIAFRSNDQFLIGSNSCGAYLFMQTNDIEDLKIKGNQLDVKRFVKSGKESSIRIPIRFQFRMTDFFGSGTTGTGNIDGDISGSIKNVTYEKVIGIDILYNDFNKYSFDLKFFAKYKADGVTVIETNKF